ncbi:hypothetical protein GON03_19035 [Nocardioides sp. MAH-18]|uniref:Uncharacterized protein n=1 Tax=Nocardioides agri TaxID=2682843 RepID=A0A6L6XV53_9ACTN|nr:MULTISPECIES: hypothetical protein [unclassified Nocardioides]MBA2952112.1 hypothetical protein [Nocardioides sp. CGMCC 1.13656]MVQ51281.1 hypothetical protein [Nocardioides sp. MAH-18]
MANLPALTTVVTGTTIAPITPAAGGDTVPIGSRVIVRNGSGASINVTIDTPGNDTYGQARPDIVTAVAAGAVAIFGPFAVDLADPITQVVKLTCSATASVELRVVAF